MFIEKVKAWKEILKMGKVRSMQGEVNRYFRENVIQRSY